MILLDKSGAQGSTKLYVTESKICKRLMELYAFILCVGVLECWNVRTQCSTNRFID